MNFQPAWLATKRAASIAGCKHKWTLQNSPHTHISLPLEVGGGGDVEMRSFYKENRRWWKGWGDGGGGCRGRWIAQTGTFKHELTRRQWPTFGLADFFMTQRKNSIWAVRRLSLRSGRRAAQPSVCTIKSGARTSFDAALLATDMSHVVCSRIPSR